MNIFSLLLDARLRVTIRVPEPVEGSVSRSPISNEYEALLVYYILFRTQGGIDIESLIENRPVFLLLFSTA